MGRHTIRSDTSGVLGAYSLQVAVLGLNHRRATLALREALSFPPCDLEEALRELGRYVPEGVILSTCHRVELYAAVEDISSAEADLKRFWSRARGVPVAEFAAHTYFLTGRKAVEHILTVAAGLDSAVIGEPQILGQVRRAHRAGMETGSAGPVLDALFRRAVTCGKRARTETGVGRNPVSVSYAAVELARKELGGLRNAHALLVGAGKMGELAAKHLAARGAARISIVGRSAERVHRLARDCGATAMPGLEEALVACDVAITCTSAPHHVIRRDMVQRVMQSRSGRPLVIIDIAVPRDVDPAVGGLPGVRLFNVDELESAIAANLRERRAEARKVVPIIQQETAAFQAWLNTRAVVPVIRALQEQAEAIRREELWRTRALLQRLPEDDRRRIEALTRAIERKLLHQPIAFLRAHAASGNGHEVAEALRRLFALEVGPPPEPASLPAAPPIVSPVPASEPAP